MFLQCLSLAQQPFKIIGPPNIMGIGQDLV